MESKKSNLPTHPPKFGHNRPLSQTDDDSKPKPQDPPPLDPARFEEAATISAPPRFLTGNKSIYDHLETSSNNMLFPPAPVDEFLPSKNESSEQFTGDKAVSDVFNRNYVDAELRRHIFAYGPYSPTRISRTGIPRPHSFVQNPETEILYETTKNHGLIPTFGNHKIVDTGSASPIYMTPTFTYLPVFGGSLSDMRLPFGVLVQPFAENVDDTVPQLDFLSFMEKRSKARRDLIRCKNCQAYYNPYMHVRSRNSMRVCNFCYATFQLTDEQMEAIDRINAHHTENTPLKKGSVDYVAPSHYYTRVKEPGAISSLLTRAGSIPMFKTQAKQEEYIYDTYSVAPVPADMSGNYNTFAATSQENGGEQSVNGGATEGQPIHEFQYTEDTEIKYPVYTFMIETTSQASRIGLRESVLTSLINALSALKEEVFDLCVLFFDSAVYSFTVANGRFAVNVVSEVEDNFTPCTASEIFLRVTPENHEEVKEYLEKLLTVQTLRTSPNCCANFALNCALRVMSSEDCYGTISIFHATQPDIGLGSDPQMFAKSTFTMSELQISFYSSLLQVCYATGICVDVYLCPPETRIPGDIQLMHIAQQTGGNCVYLPRFEHKFDYFKVYHEIVRLLKVPCGYKCELKLRCSKHIKITELLCSFNNARAVKDYSTVTVPRIGPNLSIGFMLSLNDMVDNKTGLYMQVACLYTNTKGVPMVRVHTNSTRVISSMNEIFRNTNQDAIINLIARKLAYNYIRNGKYNRDQYISMVVEALTAYRHICASTTPKNQLILPDNLKLLPAYLNAVLKYDIKGEYGFDFVMKLLGILNSSVKITHFIYARTYSIHRSIYEKHTTPPEGGFKFHFTTVPSATENVYSDGIYLIDDGYKLLVFVGPHVKSTVLYELFGHDYQFPHMYVNSTELKDTPTSRNMMELVEQVRSQHKGCPYLPLKIITYTAKNSKYIKTLMLEDELGEEPRYSEFLVTIHRQILQSREKLF
nr:protein transport protein sec24-like [Theileria orientalis]